MQISCSKKQLLKHNDTVNLLLVKYFSSPSQLLLNPTLSQHHLKNLRFVLIFPVSHTSHYFHLLTLLAIADEFPQPFPLFLDAKLNADEYSHHQTTYAKDYYPFVVDIYPTIDDEHFSIRSPIQSNHLDTWVFGVKLTNFALNRGISHAIDKLLFHQLEKHQAISMLDFANIAKFLLLLVHPYPRASLSFGE